MVGIAQKVIYGIANGLCVNIFVEIVVERLEQTFVLLSYLNLVRHPSVAAGGSYGGKPRRVEALMYTFGFGSLVFGYPQNIAVGINLI